MEFEDHHSRYGYVDSGDFDLFSACATGPDTYPIPDGCGEADLDGDGDVDQSDFRVMQQCLSGNFVVADPGCAP